MVARSRIRVTHATDARGSTGGYPVGMRRVLLLASVGLAALPLLLAGCGGSTSTETAAGGAVAADLPTEPPSNKDTKFYPWYAGNPQILRATSGAPISGQNEAGVHGGDDGIMGSIKNQSTHDVLVETKWMSGCKCPGKAILKPGDELPYKLFAAGDLAMSELSSDGKVVPNTTSKLWIKDPYIGYPSSAFTPPGKSEPTSKRDGWREGTGHEEIWGETRIGVKRETDGWRIPASDAYTRLYGDPNTKGSSDWAIFTITIYNL